MRHLGSAQTTDYGKIVWARAQNTGAGDVPAYGVVSGQAQANGSFTVDAPSSSDASAVATIFFSDGAGITAGAWGKITRHEPFPAACDASVSNGQPCGTKVGSYQLWGAGDGVTLGFVALSAVTNGVALVARMGGGAGGTWTMFPGLVSAGSNPYTVAEQSASGSGWTPKSGGQASTSLYEMNGNSDAPPNQVYPCYTDGTNFRFWCPPPSTLNQSLIGAQVAKAASPNFPVPNSGVTGEPPGKVPFDTLKYDKGGFTVDGDYTQFVVPLTGFYRVDAQVNWAVTCPANVNITGASDIAHPGDVRLTGQGFAFYESGSHTAEVVTSQNYGSTLSLTAGDILLVEVFTNNDPGAGISTWIYAASLTISFSGT